MGESEEDLDAMQAKINQETARLPWVDLLRFFARGRVVVVDSELDLVRIAAIAAIDRADELQSLLARGAIAKVSDEQARRWLATDALLWTVVVKPWVLVQEPKSAAKRQLH